MKNKKFLTPLLKRKFPQIRGQSIFKLAQTNRRLKRLASGVLHADWEKSPSLPAIYSSMIDKSLLGQKALKQELDNRRVNAPAFRSALPLKQQRILEASMNSVPAQRLLAGASLAIV